MTSVLDSLPPPPLCSVSHFLKSPCIGIAPGHGKDTTRTRQGHDKDMTRTRQRCDKDTARIRQGHDKGRIRGTVKGPSPERNKTSIMPNSPSFLSLQSSSVTFFFSSQQTNATTKNQTLLLFSPKTRANFCPY
ncbi:MAG: hypothetical protein BYD32DRAFT_311512 [Podila humilis]|nr:MAG: hypothetical protein BYD32DRAFT_311512 [Podila humilis]